MIRVTCFVWWRWCSLFCVVGVRVLCLLFCCVCVFFFAGGGVGGCVSLLVLGVRFISCISAGLVVCGSCCCYVLFCWCFVFFCWCLACSIRVIFLLVGGCSVLCFV